ncbi:MAG: hypothetical protein HWD61_04640 [Parachlamydiaceae bacterium]|nr:MAG: hypothetical protein HWD61_04640 [Parachlamydiaceae bacterium]
MLKKEIAEAKNDLLQDSQWLNIKGARFSNENGYLKMTLGGKELNLMLGNSNHGEYSAVRDFLKLSDHEAGQLVTIVPQNSGPDLMFKTPEGKIRIYQGGPAQNDSLFLYKEYENLEEAIDDYSKANHIDFLISLIRAQQSLNVREPLKDDFFLMRNGFLKSYLDKPITEAQRAFITHFLTKTSLLTKRKIFRK